jgi:hypothetical protein
MYENDSAPPFISRVEILSRFTRRFLNQQRHPVLFGQQGARVSIEDAASEIGALPLILLDGFAVLQSLRAFTLLRQYDGLIFPETPADAPDITLAGFQVADATPEAGGSVTPLLFVMVESWQRILVPGLGFDLSMLGRNTLSLRQEVAESPGFAPSGFAPS